MLRAFAKDRIPIPKDFQPLKVYQDRPLDIEIGCGVGFHPLRYARENPERQLVAFERTREKFAKFQRRLENHPPLPNLIPIHGDAVPWIAHGVEVESVDRYFLLYPNPYPKEGQRNQRWYAMPFFSELLRTLKPGGEIRLVTNMEYYWREAKEALLQSSLELVQDRRIEKIETPRTHFEKKYLARGETCYELVFRKRES